MKRTAMGVVLVAMVLVTMVGCGGGMPGAGKTPKETLRNMLAAMEAGDGKAYVDCFSGGPEAKRVMETCAADVAALLQFARKMNKAYGPEAARNSIAGSQWELDQIVKQPEKMIAKIDGDKAKLIFDGKDGPEMVKEGGVWRMKMREKLKFLADHSIKISKLMRESAESVEELVGKPGQTPKTIQKFIAENYGPRFSELQKGKIKAMEAYMIEQGEKKSVEK